MTTSAVVTDSEVLGFLSDAGLLDSNFRNPLLTHETFDKLASRERLYCGADAGGRDITVGRLLDAVRHHDWLEPIRSGRTGNWAAIWSGRAPLLSYNRAVTVDLDVARPLIHSLALTETTDLSAGDVVYRPGSIHQDGALRQIKLTSPLVGWQDLDRSVPRFVPWTWGRTSVGPVNLVHLHGEPLRSQSPVPVLSEGDLIWQNSRPVQQWLTRLWEHAAHESTDGDISWLFSYGVSRDASIARLIVRQDGSVFVMSVDDGDTWEKVGTADQLADRCLLPYRVVAQADDAEPLLRSAPEVTPLLSLRLAKALMGYLGASSDAQHDPYSQPDPFALLVEWGGLAQAGYPPVRHGYFSSEENQTLAHRTVTSLARANDLPALLHLVLPLAPVILMPSTAEPLDVAWLSSFFQQLRTAHLSEHPERALAEAGRVYRWWAKKDAVSEFYRAKFTGDGTITPFGQGDVAAQTIEQVEVRALTLREAGLAVATFFDMWRGNA